jgi:predicted RecB family nuclease
LKEDNLSLLNRITLKQILSFEKKGIFTVKQLTFLYKPRRKSKRTANSANIYKPELQALAIRTGKTFINQLPVFERKKIELFLDVESRPESFYYLFGILIIESGKHLYESFWSATEQEEKLHG